MTRTPEHEAALDALEGMVRWNQDGPNPTILTDTALHPDALPTLVSSGRAVWVDESTGHARFIPKPKPLLSEEQVAEVMRLAGNFADVLAQKALGKVTLMSAGHAAGRLQAYLTSLTQEGE